MNMNDDWTWILAEEELYWSQGALEMIECIGAQNWLFTQV